MFVKARPVPYSLKDKVAKELDRLVREGIITPVASSEWATPIVIVPKKDGSIRICGDFRITVNKAIKVEMYPLPKVEDIFAAIGGSTIFSKIDLLQAYLQMELDENSVQSTHTRGFIDTTGYHLVFLLLQPFGNGQWNRCYKGSLKPNVYWTT